MFLFAIVALFSCSESNVQKRSYTETDVEGYWATYDHIYTSWLSDEIRTNSQYQNHQSLIRLYNDVCGTVDSTFKVVDNIIMFKRYTAPDQYEWHSEYLIEFASNERLMLYNLVSKKSYWFYNLNSIPSSDERIDSLLLSPARNGVAITFQADGLSERYIENDPNLIICFSASPDISESKFDPIWWRRLENLALRVDVNGMLTCRNRYYRPTLEFVNGELIDSSPVIPSSYLVTIYTERHVITNGDGKYSTSAAFAALCMELEAFEWHRNAPSQFRL